MKVCDRVAVNIGIQACIVFVSINNQWSIKLFKWNSIRHFIYLFISIIQKIL